MKKQTVKPSGALKKLLAANKSNTRVIKHVEKYLLNKPNHRNMQVMHPSAMSSKDWCHREQYWLMKGKKPKDEGYTLKTQLTFAMGHAIHSTWQTWFKEMNVLKGVWFCHACQEEWFGLPEDHIIASYCNLEYNEVPLKWDPLMISGNADGWLVEFEEPLLLEIKSIGEGSFRWYAPQLLRENDQDFAKAWKALEQPFEEHVTQAQIYLKLGELMGLKDFPKEILFLYEAKALHEVKEFVVRKSDFKVNPVFEAAAMIVKALDDNEPPLCNIAGELKCNKCIQYEESTDGIFIN